MNISRALEKIFIFRRLGPGEQYEKERSGQPGNSQKEMPDTVRARYAYLEAWTSIIVNTVLAAIKVGMGLLFDSISLLADGAHTASDVLTSVIVLLGFRTANIPPDEEHPYGHGRTEPLATLIIAILLIITGLSFGYNSVMRFIAGAPVRGSYGVALVMLASMVIKEWMARFSIYLGRKISSDALIADAWHHRSDAIASALVAVAMVGASLGYPFLDAVFGLIVSALIVWTGIMLGLDTSSVLLGKAPSRAFIEAIENTVSQVPGVDGMHKLSVHDYGIRKALSLHIQVDRDLSVEESHDIAENVERAIESCMNVDVVVHIEPMRD